MKLYNALHRVMAAAKPFTGGTAVTPKTSSQNLSELFELLDAVKEAEEAGAAPYQIVEAVSGDVPMHLKD